MKKKEIVVHFEMLEYLAYFGPIPLRFFLMWSFDYTHSILPYMYVIKVIIPLIDWVMPLDMRNRNSQEQEALEKDWRYLIPLYASAATELYLCYWLLETIYWILPELSWYQIILFVLFVGTTTGGNLVLGHELTHRKEKIHYFTGLVLYLRFLYTNFALTHTQGHHKWVATPLDPASAEQGISVFKFGVRSMRGSFWQGWNIEQDRLQKKYPTMGRIGRLLHNEVA